MKRTLLLVFFLTILGFESYSQSQIAIPFQAVARNLSGTPISNQTISVRISILDSIPTGPLIYAETHSVTTNELGLFDLSIGKGTIIPTVGPFDPTKWKLLSSFIKVELDATGGSTYVDMGTSQILCVPFSAYSSTSGSSVGATTFISEWNAVTNTPPLSNSVGVKGQYYVVSNASSVPSQNTDLNGIEDWGVGDWAIYNGTSWGKVDNSELSTGSVSYKGTWDADNNSPNLSSSIGNKGDYYVVSNASAIPSQNTDLNGIEDWEPGDWAIYDGTHWGKVDNSETPLRNMVLTGLNLSTNQVINATDSAVSALGKLQKQISDNLAALTSHVNNTSNPHSVTKSQVGLGNVDNVADVDKPVSIPQAAALDTKANKVAGAVAGDIPTANQFGDLIDSGKKPSDYLDKSNTTSYTPTANFHPATKKYVDDHVGSFIPNGTKFGQTLHWDGATWMADSGIFSNGHQIGIGVDTSGAPFAVVPHDVLKSYFVSFMSYDASQFWSLNLNPSSLGNPGFSIEDNHASGLKSRLFLQETTGFVGLGTIQPNVSLHVTRPATDPLSDVSLIENTGIVVVGPINSNHLALDSRQIQARHGDYTPGGLSLSESQLGLQPLGGGLVIHSSLSPDQRITITPDGNIGIGTDTPDVPLSIVNRSVLKSYFIRCSSHDGSQDWTINLNPSSLGNPGFSIEDSHAPGLMSRLFIQETTGYVGLGTIQPNVSLHVTRPATDPLSDVSLIENTGIIVVGPINSNHVVLDSRQIQARHGDYTPGGLALSQSPLGLQPLGGDITIHSSLSADKKITISSDGMIGIGILPEAPLSIKPRVSLYEEFISFTSPDDIQKWNINLNPTSNSDKGFSIDDRNILGLKSRLFIQESTGNVGLGTVQPIEKLHINGAIAIGNSTTPTPANGTIRWSGSDFEGRKNGVWTSLTAGGSSFWTEGGVGTQGVIYYQPPGVGPKVGIGLSTPTATLHVKETNTETTSSTSLLISNEATNILNSSDNRVGVNINTSGTWSSNAQALNIGLYVSNVSGQSSSNKNIAAVINGNTVIGDVVAGQSAVGTNGEKVLAIQNGAPPTSTLGSATNVGIQIYSDEILTGTSVLHVMNGDGTVMKFYSEAALTAASALPVAGGYDVNEMTVINNMRTRLIELENRLQALGLLH